ncbi:Rne/Rng family ribonuclease, partial [bacterium]|nr:Rne/Rng family ribonuclease [bacterium]
AYAESLKAEDDEEEKPKKRSRSRSRSRAKASDVEVEDAVVTAEVDGMETIDLGDDDDEGSSPMTMVGETPVDTPASDEDDSEDDDADADDSSDDKDDEIESVAEEDDTDDVRPVRKPRPKRYKIQEVVKVRQILLIQVVKEERGNKGAALTTYLSLAGRYCVLMPNTARGGGISRKITNIADRKKLKEIAGEMTVPEGAGLIIRTAGSQRTKAEIKRDYEYLQRMWEQIRALTLKSIAPEKIYEEGDLIKRSIRDLYNKDIDEVIVAGEAGYRNAKDFMKMIMPSHSKNVKFYTEQLPLYARYQVEGYLAGMFNPTVQLPSGGYIVIGITEALVAIDVNSGRATKEGSIEQTATKTNLEAADEVARQLRLRDLAGLIVIDFIDMDERRNNIAVEKRMKDKLKTDRARIQVGRISGFGLMEMSRQRLRPGMLEATTQMCGHCHGTGLLRSDDNVALSILRALEEEGVRGRSKEVLVRCPITIANFLMNGKREHIGDIEARYGMSVRIECDTTLISPDFAIEKFKTATRVVPDAAPIVASAIMFEDDDDDIVEETPDEEEVTAPQGEAAVNAETADGEERPKKKRRRRRRRRGGSGNGEAQLDENGNPIEVPEAAEAPADAAETPAVDGEDALAEKPKRTRSRSRKKVEETAEVAAEAAPADAEVTAEPAAEEEKPKKRTRSRKKVEPAVEAEAGASEEVAEAPVVKEKPKRKSRAKPKVAVAEAAPEAVEVAAVVEAPAAVETPVVVETPAVVETPVVVDAAPEPTPEPKKPDAPKRKGWWSLGR